MSPSDLDMALQGATEAAEAELAEAAQAAAATEAAASATEAAAVAEAMAVLAAEAEARAKYTRAMADVARTEAARARAKADAGAVPTLLAKFRELLGSMPGNEDACKVVSLVTNQGNLKQELFANVEDVMNEDAGERTLSKKRALE